MAFLKVMGAAHDVNAPRKTVKAFDPRSIIVGGRLVTQDGVISVQIIDRRPVSEFIRRGR